MKIKKNKKIKERKIKMLIIMMKKKIIEEVNVKMKQKGKGKEIKI